MQSVSAQLCSKTMGNRAFDHPGRQRTHRDVLHCNDPADAFARRWRGSKPSRRRPCRARGEPQGCAERRQFPLRA